MKSNSTPALLVAAFLFLWCPAHAATIQLEIYNSSPLIDSLGAPLAGDTNAGDLVQIILAGSNQAINPPAPDGGVTGDDTLLFTTHVGAGILGNPDQGLLDVFPVSYAPELVGSNAYVRFWDSTTAGTATHYGNTTVFPLPAGDAFNQAIFDFVPLDSALRTTDLSFIPPISGMTLSAGEISISWIPSNDPAVVAYQIYRDGTLLATTIASNRTDTGLAADTQYCYSIVAVDAGGLPVGSALDICLRTYRLAGSEAGIFNGLAIRTSAPSPETSALLRLVLSKTGSFSARLAIDGDRFGFKGQFDASGNATNFLPRSGQSALQVALGLDVSNSTDQITGTISDGDFVSELLADRATFSSSNPCPWAGRYAFLIAPAGDGDPNLPQGYGFGTLTLSPTGSAKLAGFLGDGLKLKATVPFSKFGTAPLLVRPYKNQGVCVTWLTILTNQTLEAVTDWIKPPVSADPRYPAGFTATVDLTGAKSVTPSAGQRRLTLSGGNLASNLVTTVTFDASGKATVLNPGPENLSLSASLVTGQFKGSFTHPVLNQKISLAGQFVAPDSGAGTFVGDTETGAVLIEPLP
jgi:hypothetical protein